jgi:hypothetical protein
MSLAPNFTLISELMSVQRRDFDLAVPDLLNPLNANPLIDGEWLALDTNYALVRGSGEAAKPTWPVFAEKGRYDTQAIGKTTVLFGGFYEASSRVYTVGSLAVGDFLVVADVTVDGQTKKGLIEAAGSGQHWVVGVVTKLETGRVRFWHNGGFQITI